jgi:mRNA-degrading endonuclease RelE of RelBE toxin-antitoxin system
MNVQLQDRAEVALRSLDPPEREKIRAALRELERTDLGEGERAPANFGP